MTSSDERSVWMKVGAAALWVLIVLEMLGMGLAGISKFQGPGWPNMFEGWGYPRGFAYVIGALEALGAVALLVPRIATYAAMGLIVIMLGAIFTVTTTTFETQLGPGIATIHVVVLLVIGYARRNRRWRPGG